MRAYQPSAAASRRLARDIQVGDWVLFGDAVHKVRVPLPANIKGGRADGYARTKVRAFGQVTRITPSGCLRLEVPGRLEEVALTAPESSAVEVMSDGQVTRRLACRPGWEDNK